MRAAALACGAALAMLIGCSRPAPPAEEMPWFREAAEESGLRFRHFPGATGEFFLPEIMGPGGALLDYDQDGDLDVFLVQGARLTNAPGAKLLFPPEPDQPEGDRLFRNDLIPGGKLAFSDVTRAAGLSFTGYGMGAAAADYDNDGYPDLYVTRFGRNALFHNNGNGTFTEQTHGGLDDPRWSTSATFFDYDRDGDLDLFFTNYVAFTVENNKKCYSPAGALDYCTPKAYQPLPHRLFRNEGGGRFADVSESSGIGSKRGPGLGVVAFDYDQDGWADLYVANDGAANFLWRNRGNGTFEEIGLESGVAYGFDGMEQAGMGVDAADFTNSGRDAIFVTNLTGELNNLYVRDPSGVFVDEIMQSGLAQAGRRMTGFGTRFFDYDNDGALDLFVANGAVTIMESLRGDPFPFHQENQLFRNEAGRFTDVSSQAGRAFELSEVSRGAAFGDIDNDGDIDILVNNDNGPVRLLLNEVGGGRPSLTVSLRGSGPVNRDGIGARVSLLSAGKPVATLRCHTDGSYLSASDPRVQFGLGGLPKPEQILVAWPDGSRETWPSPTGRAVELVKGSGTPAR